jgi:RNA-directed DNA polymerase
MTAASQPAGAASHGEKEWQAINWQAAHRHVRRLQARIVQATQAGRWNRVKALQHLLTHSYSGKVLAVKRVTENQGRHTPGVDRVLWDTPEKKTRAIHELRPRGYQPCPLRRVYIPKSNGKKRPLGIPTLQDRAMQALQLLALDPVAETHADPNSYGFRKERACADALAQCFAVLHQKGAAQWVLEGDICACFDRISHDWLLAHVPMDQGLLRKWLKAGYMEKHVLFPTEAGTPQGGIASPVLANLALDGLEARLREHFPRTSQRHRRGKVNLIRYADDFLVTGSSRELLENEVKPLVEQFLRERGLELSPEKTTITHVEDGFDFLGQNVRKYHGGKVLLITPAKKNVQTFLETIRKVVKEHAATPAGELIGLLNPKIRGWANYHRHVVSKATFTRVDHAIFQCLWQWASRRHPRKNRRWIKEKYFRSCGGDRWVFAGERQGKDHVSYPVRLYKAATTPIRRHIKVRGEANPYDPVWEVYFEARLGVKMTQNLRGRRTLLYLWKEQGGRCPRCEQAITEVTGWHSHHLIPRSLGGGDQLDNRVLLHPNCHRQVHHQQLAIAKPRSSRSVREA